jgi:7-cyano-7-deazaguanine synthase in queuosine biosynthesis
MSFDYGQRHRAELTLPNALLAIWVWSSTR